MELLSSLPLGWMARYGHVVSAALWLSGYAVLGFVLIPHLKTAPSPALFRLAMTAVRVSTYAGTATILFGVFLVTQTRGFASVTFNGEWGLIIIACIFLAVVLLGLGDGALRPALRRMAAGGDATSARRFALIGFALVVIAMGLMTRALYASSNF